VSQFQRLTGVLVPPPPVLPREPLFVVRQFPGLVTTDVFIEVASPFVLGHSPEPLTVSAEIETVMDSNLALIARQSVAAFNVLPSDLAKMPPPGDPQPPTPPPCKPHAHPTYHWWGATVYMNDCLCNTLMFATGSAGAIAGMIAGVCPPCAPIAGPLGAFLGIYTSWLVWANQRCGNRGVNANVSWLDGVWLKTVC
jgi:hypothetical protein